MTPQINEYTFSHHSCELTHVEFSGYGRDEISLRVLSLPFPCHQSAWLSRWIQTTTAPCSLIPLECKLPQTKGLSFLNLQLVSQHATQTRQPYSCFWITATVFFWQFLESPAGCTPCIRSNRYRIHNKFSPVLLALVLVGMKKIHEVLEDHFHYLHDESWQELFHLSHAHINPY